MDMVFRCPLKHSSSVPRHYPIPQVDMWSLGVILFVLNSARMPFCNPSQTGPQRPPITRQIQEGLYEFTLPEWSARSAAVCNLIDRLLTVQPDLRATAAEVPHDRTDQSMD